jgi:hypothetical protein
MQAQLETVLETIMSVKHAMAENDYTLCFKILDTLEQMLEKDDYLYGLYEGVDWIRRIREECRKTVSLFDRIYAHFAAVLDGNFNRAYFLIDEISILDPSDAPVNVKLNEITAMLRSSTEFEALARDIEAAKTLNDFDEVRKLNTDYMNKWALEDIGHIEEVENFIADNLSWLVQELMNNKRLQEGLEVCDQGLNYYNSLNEETSYKRGMLQNLRESCEYGLITRSLAEAEAAENLSACLELLSRLEGVWRQQRTTKGQARHIFLILGEQLVNFLRCCYEDGCIPCARWARCKEKTQVCVFDIERTQRSEKLVQGYCRKTHDRTVFEAPFGCAHHCIGGYCFYR